MGRLPNDRPNRYVKHLTTKRNKHMLKSTRRHVQSRAEVSGRAEPSTRTYFCSRTARTGVPFSISQLGEDAVPPGNTDRQHSLPL